MAATVARIARVIGRQEINERHQEHAGIELLRAVVLGKRLDCGVVAGTAHLRVDACLQAAPVLDVGFKAAPRRDRETGLQRDPRIYFRVDILPAAVTCFPNPVPRAFATRAPRGA